MKDSRSDFYEEISCFAKLNRAVECQLVIEVPLKKNKISITLVIKKEAKRYTNESSFVMSQGLFFFFLTEKLIYATVRFECIQHNFLRLNSIDFL